MPNNYVLLDRIELNATATSVTFDNIPQTGYTDLKIVSSIRAFDNNEWITLAINGATTNISGRYLYGNGASASSGTISAGGLLNPMVPSSWTANTFSSNEFYITNYASTTTAKSIFVDGIAEQNSTSSDIMMSAIVWNSTAAITSVRVQTTAGTFAVGSTFSLYGIAKLGTTPAIAPKADGGNVIGTDGTYWYHAFLSNGTFTPQVALSADVLVVAGGGGAGGGGGGAGGLVYSASQSLAATGYTCTVGAGGAGGTSGGSPSPNGSNGANSVFGSITATGGGGGGGINNSAAAGSGGSGGGAGAVTGTAGSASPAGQGNAGGSIAGFTGANYPSAGGGGAGAVGGNPTSNNNAGNGGAGVNTYSSWATATNTGVSGYYAGGGGGGMYNIAGATAGTGGAGGGGNGAQSGGTAGTANTGGGGGGGNQTPQNAGGSGIIIVRYLVA